MKLLIAQISVGVRRDITTTLSLQIAEHEIPVLQSAHGEDNVFVGGPTGQAAGYDPENEHQRLIDKYGAEAVRDAYGTSARGDIRRSIVAGSLGEYEEENNGIVLEGPDSKPPGEQVAKVATPKADELPDGKPGSQWSKADLVEYAAVNGIEVDADATKAVVLAAINAAGE